MPHLLTGIDWIENQHLRSMPQRETRQLTVTVNCDEVDATWEEGVGIDVGGHDFGKGDIVKIDGTPHRVTKMRRMVLENEAVTLIIKRRELA